MKNRNNKIIHRVYLNDKFLFLFILNPNKNNGQVI